MSSISSTLKRKPEDCMVSKGERALKKPCIIQQTYDQNTTNIRPFSCPFYRKDPQRHTMCSSLKYQNINRLKQHITRKHTKVEFCPVCGATFKDTASCHDHIRRRTCQESSFVKPDGITPEQRQALGKRTSSTLSREEQWFCVFDIVCPGHHPRPISPYHEPAMCGDTLAHLRKYGPQIFIASLRQEDQWPSGIKSSLIEPVLCRALETTFDRLAASSPGSKCSQQHNQDHAIETSHTAESSKSIADTSSWPITAAADNFFVTQMPQGSSASEHFDNIKDDDASWAVVGAPRGLVAFMPMLNDLPNFTTGSLGAKEEGQFVHDLTWDCFASENMKDI